MPAAEVRLALRDNGCDISGHGAIVRLIGIAPPAPSDGGWCKGGQRWS